MTIKTAVTLMTGAAVGFLFGLNMSEKDKERIGRAIKGKIFFLLTGERMDRYTKYKANYKTDYKRYSDYMKGEKL